VSRFTITVSPGAHRSRLVGRHGDGWKAQVAAPPECGRANAALVELVATALGVPRSDLRIVGGHTSRIKVVEVSGLDSDQVAALLGSAAR
jgi:uncharacterized protein YggU (UPF0235/DUF167 family)